MRSAACGRRGAVGGARVVLLAHVVAAWQGNLAL